MSIEMSYKKLTELNYKNDSKIFEKKVKEIMPIGDEQKCLELYQALANVIWYNPIERLMYSASWRYAGGLAAKFDGKSEHDMAYCRWYCSGGEGQISNWFKNEMKERGWYYTYEWDI